MGVTVLIDGRSILERAFLGLPDLTDHKGRHTSAIGGFFDVLFAALDGNDGAVPAVVYGKEDDRPREDVQPLERRKEEENLLKVLEDMEICVVSEPEIRTMDLLYSFAKKAEEEGGSALIVTGRKALFQAAGGKTGIAFPGIKDGTLVLDTCYAKEVEERTGVTPERIPDFLALTAVDKERTAIIGPAAAAKLLAAYGTIDGVYAHIDEIKGENLQGALEEKREGIQGLLKKNTAVKEASLPSLSSLEVPVKYTAKAYALFRDLDLERFLSRFGKELEKAAAEKREKEVPLNSAAPVTKLIIKNRKGSAAAAGADDVFEKALSALKDGKTVGVVPIFDVPHLKLPDTILGIGIAVDASSAAFLAAAKKDGGEEDEALITEAYLTKNLRALRLAAKDNEKARLAVFDIKGQYPFWGIDDTEFHDGIKLGGIFDTLIGAYLINPLKSDYQPEDIAKEYTGRELVGRKALLAKQSFEEKLQADERSVCAYAMDEALALRDAAPLIEKKLEEEEMAHLYKDVELPLSFILFDMQRIGIRVVPEKLKAYGDRLTGRIAELEEAIHDKTGDPDFNIASPKQLGEVLFEKMKLPGGKKTKSGWSTSADILEKLSPDYPVVADILEYRALTKLKSTYADGLAAYIADDSRIHTTFNQTITATGRISSTDPNLQNIPMRTQLGREIRKVFIPKDGWSFTDSDYSQIELRILASMSGDEALIEAYKGGRDIHRMTASKVFNTPFEEVTDLQRRNAKAVNFGIVYGISSFGLSQGLSISRKEAQEYINQYFRMFPGIKTFLDRQVQDAKNLGYSVTMMGRRRPIPELKESSYMRRQFGERVAMNAPIQGTGADIMKVAMIRVWEMLHKKDMQSRLILQIHDELLIETAPGEEQEVMDILKEGMMGAADLKVSLEVDCHNGSDWYEAK